MKAAYVDTSCMVAIAFGDPVGEQMAKHLETYDELFSSSLMEAELRAALAREASEGGAALLTWISWVLPDRPLGPEIDRVLRAGFVRGPELWHLATALYLVESPADLAFLTLDGRQSDAAVALGFPTGG